MLIVRLCSFLAETELFILLYLAFLIQGFPGGSDGKNKSACNAGDPGSILDQEYPLEKGMANHSSILAWRIPVDREAWQATVHGTAKSLAKNKLLGQPNEILC